MVKQYAVVTVAVGKTYYLNIAKNLLLSFLLWNRHNDIQFLLVTDNRDFFKEFFDIPKVEIKIIVVNEENKSFTSKFLLFEYVNAQENLFIDCDCIIYRDLKPVFTAFKHQDFSVIGENVHNGNFFCDVEHIIEHFDLPYLPIFVGSVYYFKNNDTAKSIFEMASSLKKNYDNHGFIRLRGKENEEPLFACAMARFNQLPIIDNGTIKADAMFYDKFNCNVLQGKAVLTNKCISNQAYFSPKISEPAIVHFNDRYTEMADYLSEQYRLRSNLPSIFSTVVVQVKFKLPEYLISGFKKMLRPIYHKTLGPSEIKKIKRLD